MNRLDNLRAAADDAAKKALQKIEKINASQFQNLISELRKGGVDAKIISQLESSIADATRRNKLLAELIEKGGNVANQLIAFSSKIF